MANEQAGPREAISQLGEGWIAEEALAIGLYATLKGATFQQAIAIAANHDGDSDSTASIAGQLWGAAYGIDDIPHDWITDLDVLDVSLQLIEKAMPSKATFPERLAP